MEDTVTVVRFSQILDKPDGHDRGDEGLRRRPELRAVCAAAHGSARPALDVNKCRGKP